MKRVRATLTIISGKIRQMKKGNPSDLEVGLALRKFCESVSRVERPTGQWSMGMSLEDSTHIGFRATITKEGGNIGGTYCVDRRNYYRFFYINIVKLLHV
jgi:hypothetical protein